MEIKVTKNTKKKLNIIVKLNQKRKLPKQRNSQKINILVKQRRKK